MSDIAGKMAEWRKTLWGTGPCPDSSQNNFTLTDAEREEVRRAREALLSGTHGYDNQFANEKRRRAAVLAGILERLG